MRSRPSLIGASDVSAGVSGRLPISISVDEAGNPGVTVPGEPGWFRN